MARDYSKVRHTFWTGTTGRILRRDADAQRVALYLMSCASSNMIGLYRLTLPAAAHEIGLTQARVEAALGRLSEAGFADYDAATETVWVRKMAEQQLEPPLKPGDSKCISVRTDLDLVVDSPFLPAFIAQYADGLCLNAVLTGKKKSNGEIPPDLPPYHGCVCSDSVPVSRPVTRPVSGAVSRPVTRTETETETETERETEDARARATPPPPPEDIESDEDTLDAQRPDAPCGLMPAGRRFVQGKLRARAEHLWAEWNRRGQATRDGWHERQPEPWIGACAVIASRFDDAAIAEVLAWAERAAEVRSGKGDTGPVDYYREPGFLFGRKGAASLEIVAKFDGHLDKARRAVAEAKPTPPAPKRRVKPLHDYTPEQLAELLPDGYEGELRHRWTGPDELIWWYDMPPHILAVMTGPEAEAERSKRGVTADPRIRSLEAAA